MPRAWHSFTLFALLLSGATVCVPTVSWATLYQCTDASGAEVFTDSPTQLEKCTPVNPGIAAEPPPLSAPPRRPPDASAPQEVRPAPDAQRTQPPARRNVPLPREAENQPMFRSRRAAPQPGAPSPSQPGAAQRCANPINPLNPLLSIPCGEPPSQ